MAYADYAFYVEQYKGARISVQEFPVLSERASEYIDYITKGKATDTDAVKRACCAMAESLQMAEKVYTTAAQGTGEIASESVGSYSVTYRSGADVARESEAELHRIALRYLAHTGLLYRGRGC